MSINNFLNRSYNQTAVYWGTPAVDGFNRMTFADPVEVACRWELVDEIIRDKKTTEELKRAHVWLPQSVDMEGYLYLGTLDDLDSNPDDPITIAGADKIRSVRKIPTLNNEVTLYRANLQLTSVQRM